MKSRLILPKYQFHDPELQKWADQLPDSLDLQMALTFLPAAVASAMLAAITTTGLFMSLHSATPGNTGANELVAGTAYTAVSGGRPPVTWGSPSAGVVDSNDTQTFAILVTQSGGLPYFGLWSANTGGTFVFGSPTAGGSGSIPALANVTCTNGIALTVAG